MSEPAELPIQLKSNWQIMKTNIIAGFIAASIAEAVTIPFDTVKVYMQIQRKEHITPQSLSVMYNIRKVIQEKGPVPLYSGLTAGIVRMMIFGGIRIPLYETLKNVMCKDAQELQMTPTWKKAVAGALAGGIAIAVACPADDIKVKMQ